MIRKLFAYCGKKVSSRGGYTLIEMMIVIAIIGILTNMALPNMQRAIIRAKETSLKNSLFVLRDVIDQHYADHGKFPDYLEDLTEKRYIRNLPKDPFTNSVSTWIIIPPERERKVRFLMSIVEVTLSGWTALRIMNGNSNEAKYRETF